MVIPRTRGAVSGVLLILLGAFGALIPLVGPYFDFTIGSTRAWDLGDGHVYLSLVPGVAAAIGGFILLTSAHRARAGVGAWLALLAGAWFVVGEQVSQLWNGGQSIAGQAAGGTGRRVAEQLAYFDALGTLIVTFAALALGRLAVRSVRDEELSAAAAAVDDIDDDDRVVLGRRTRESGRFERDREPVAATSATTAATERRDAPRTDEPTTIAPAAGTTDDDRTTRTDTLSAADRVRLAARDESPDSASSRGRRGGLGRLFGRDG